LRDTFHFGPRQHGNGNIRNVELEDRLKDYWPEVAVNGARWMSADNINQPLFQFAWSCCDPSEISPLEPADPLEGQGVIYGESTAAVVIPFAAPAVPFTLSIGVGAYPGTYVGYTSAPSFLSNFASNGALWIALDDSANWTLYTNGSNAVASGSSNGGGALNGGFYRVELTYNPANSTAYGSIAGEPFGPFPVSITLPISYFGVEAAPASVCVVNNLSIYTGAPVVTTVAGPASTCIGCTAVMTATTNAAAPLGHFWHFDGQLIYEDGVLPSGATITGSRTGTLTVTGVTATELGHYTCVIANDCGITNSQDFTLGIACAADLDDGTGSGTPEGGVDINDLLYFLVRFEEGAVAVDLDNGTNTGTPDGGVDINDLLYFLSHFEAGC
jgi:uncharacterized protein YaiE (UPF0345 family)